MTSTVPRHPIRVVAERTGVSPDTLRAWERRYGVVRPDRSAGDQRLYSDRDVERLTLISRLSQHGYGLAELARMGATSLRGLARRVRVEAGDPSAEEPTPEAAPETAATLLRLRAQLRALDLPLLRATLSSIVLGLGPATALDGVVSPFLRRIGDDWAAGTLTPAEEHLASVAVRDGLGVLLYTATPAPHAPTLVATTIEGDQHEFGVMMAAATAAIAGWRVVYLGANLPAADVAALAKRAIATVVLLGVTLRQPAGALREPLREVRRKLGGGVHVFVGGPGAGDHRLAIRRATAELVDSRRQLLARLGSIWPST